MLVALYLLLGFISLGGLAVFVFAYQGIRDRRKNGQEEEAIMHPFRYAIKSKEEIPEKLSLTFNFLFYGMATFCISLLLIVVVSIL